MKTFVKILKWTGLVLLIVIAGLVLFIQFSWNRDYEAPFPEIAAATDSASIARGAYLANGISHCNTCHIPNDKIDALVAGEKVPMSGGLEFEIPGFGTFRTPNITPDAETGIGKLSDAEIARAIRYGVSHKGKAMVPFMSFQGMSDTDLACVIGYLRSLEPVSHKVEDHEFGFIGKALLAFGLMKPVGPKDTPEKFVEPDTTEAYGRYLVYQMGNCQPCHTEVDMATMQPKGPELAGKGAFPADKLTKGYSFLSPNLTPDPETGVLADWTETHFIERFKQGRVHEGSPMPWESFQNLEELELKAIYRFLMAQKPVKNAVEKTVFEPGESLPRS
ncbi:MAG: cytochrome c [Flavobacteriales bacterium]|nr:cytochrome c [Flavobacteriales bacterium]